MVGRVGLLYLTSTSEVALKTLSSLSAPLNSSCVVAGRITPRIHFRVVPNHRQRLSPERVINLLTGQVPRAQR